MKLNQNTFFLQFIGGIVLLCASCAKPLQRNSFTINDIMPAGVWKTLESSSQYMRPIKPGSIIHLDCFTATQPYGHSSLMPLHYTFDIPVRMIDTEIKGKDGNVLGKLKNYEKDFLLAYLATNTKAAFGAIPPDSALVNLWNFLMKNLWLTKGTINSPLSKVSVDYTNLENDLLKQDPTFRNQLRGLGQWQAVIIPRAIYKDHRGFFDKQLTGNNPNAVFYEPLDSDRFFSYVSFTVFVDGAFYNQNQSTEELRTWSIFDWLHSGIPIYESNKGKKIKIITFKKNSGRYKIVPAGTVPGRQVNYKISSDLLLIGNGDRKTILEEDLTNIFPPSVKRLVFRKVK
ncbi:hypothetical protein G7074_15645 [Pedobacter sp. HDW13]|uniref:hypothetical protein n=1 Tax=Pedobacter sp. HDW13 TaxID=2714940 RepID=UPI00140E8FC9|nr:hypothetical protein [Pedobacter sp. HDW13]QIL40573.1 hypothetical protein G7074_15645 [Pedobacter sp. HDW13]